MASSAKFTFDTEFLPRGDRPSAGAQARRKQTLTMEELDALKNLARHEGEQAANARAAESLERSVVALTAQIREALDESHAEIEALRGEAAALALAMARKIAAAAMQALPAAAVESALRQAMHQAVGEPRLTLRAAPAVAEALQARLKDIAHEENHDGHVLIAADAAITGTDCRIEWRGGGADRSQQAIEDTLATLIANRFSTTLKD